MGQFGSIFFPDSGGIQQPTGTPAGTTVASSATVVTLLAANTARKSATIVNGADKILYLKLGAGATTSSYTAEVPAHGSYPVPTGYTGIITGIWESGPTGNSQITEFA